MKKKVVFAHIYSDKEDRLGAVISDLEKVGYEIAYETTMSVTVIKEVEDEQEDSTT